MKEVVTNAERDRLIETMLPKLSSIVGSIYRRVPAHIDRDELFQAGSLALVEAAGRFDATRNVKFSTYAEIRIRGAMLDCLRAMRWFRRRHDDKVDSLDANDYYADTIADGRDNPERTLQLKETRRRLRQMIDGAELTRKQRLVLRFYYEKDLTMQQIGERLGYSIKVTHNCSAVSQLHSAAIRRLRTHFQQVNISA